MVLISADNIFLDKPAKVLRHIFGASKTKTMLLFVAGIAFMQV